MSEPTKAEIQAELDAVKAELDEYKRAVELLKTMGNLADWLWEKAIIAVRALKG